MLKPTLYSFVLLSLLAACGQKQEAPVTAPAPAPAAASTAPAAATPAAVAAAGSANEKGEHAYKVTCALCHATGVGGAPGFGNKADWEPRIAQGKETLYEHALKGFTGTKGAMPPKGANPSLPDDDVKAAVDYMVAKAK